MSFADEAVRTAKRLIRRRIAAPAADAFWAIYGTTLRNPDVRDGKRTSCLFLCKGNICRSPFAERIARKIAAERGLQGMEFSSAGFDVSRPLPPPAEAVGAGRTFQVELDDHRSARVTDEMVARSDMVFAMEASHLLRLKRAYPSRARDLFLLPLFPGVPRAAGRHYDRFNIGDPYGQELERFLACYGRIAMCVDAVLDAVAEAGTGGGG